MGDDGKGADSFRGRGVYDVLNRDGKDGKRIKEN